MTTQPPPEAMNAVLPRAAEKSGRFTSHPAEVAAPQCGYLIRDGQTTIGSCEREPDHDGEHQRGCKAEAAAPPGDCSCDAISEGGRVVGKHTHECWLRVVKRLSVAAKQDLKPLPATKGTP